MLSRGHNFGGQKAQNAMKWMRFINKDPRYARLLFLTAAEDEEYRRTGIIPEWPKD